MEAIVRDFQGNINPERPECPTCGQSLSLPVMPVIRVPTAVELQEIEELAREMRSESGWQWKNEG